MANEHAPKGHDNPARGIAPSVMQNQLGAAIDPNSGNIVIVHGGKPVFGLAPKDAALFVAGLCQLLAQHPQLQAPVEATPQLLIAGSVPPFARH